MRKLTLTAALVVAGMTLATVAPSFAATASNSQNGTTSSNPNATDGPPTSTSAIPATGMQMGTQPGAVQTQDGTTMNGGAMAPAGTGAGTTAAPQQ